MNTLRRITRKIKVGSTFIGGDAPILVQTMAATKTRDVDATVATVRKLAAHRAGMIRIAVDAPIDAEALVEIRKRIDANLSVDLQENFRMAEKVAPYVDKIRYNPGHLHRLEPELSWEKKVQYLVDVARDNDCALRIGVNSGSLDPEKLRQYREKLARLDADPTLKDDEAEFFDPPIRSALEHVDFVESIGFDRFCVSIKDSDPDTVLLLNRRFAALRPLVPLHLGVTEAGAPPRGILKTRSALEPLLSEGIGETLRVSLTVRADQKEQEIEAGKLILSNVANGIVANPNDYKQTALNIVSCPGCSRTQSARFVDLALEIEKATQFAKDYPFTIAVMGCRVNGPGETDDADIGLWCGGDKVNLKNGGAPVGAFAYDVVVEKAVELLKEKIRLSQLK
ncbi:MAG: flavodoxin/ferredoxin-dependent (E)-4-hydroxy-3-methylbut-2-enyl-diphosphate synthase [Planctomycetia bacterium]|nr:flavodoxin/ferredoxin-dependent (E)-4-hydroxy-3-methylbut-2-enyl-diphosphate synthase [Planctomycetia bacterium]